MIASEVGGAGLTAPMPRAREPGRSWPAWWAHLAVALGLLGAMGHSPAAERPGSKPKGPNRVTRTTAVAERHGRTERRHHRMQIRIRDLRREPQQNRALRLLPRRTADQGARSTRSWGSQRNDDLLLPHHGQKHQRGENRSRSTNSPRFPTSRTPTPNRRTKSSTPRDACGFVTPNDSEVTECSFTYGTSQQRDENRFCVPGTIAAGGEPSEAKRVEAKISGLIEKTKYFYRLHAKNGAG